MLETVQRKEEPIELSLMNFEELHEKFKNASIKPLYVPYLKFLKILPSTLIQDLHTSFFLNCGIVFFTDTSRIGFLEKV